MTKVAIYSRKSLLTGKGESIDNQIEMCKEYYLRMYGNDVEFIVYEDEGFSGGNTNRPKFQELLHAAKNKSFDALICYRLDRISRNVADFSTTLELLQNNNIEFISIKEQFDTSTPMGRAMVYISSVFAQLERETIAERVRDNMIQLSKTGRWLGGQEPFGFKSEKTSYIDENFNEKSLMKLSPLTDELKVIKIIFDKYKETNSITQVTNFLQDNLYKGKNGGEWNTSSVQRILTSPLYVKSNNATHEYLRNLGANVFGEANGNGYLSYNKTKKMIISRDVTEWIYSIANHKGIIEADDWLLVQSILEKNKSKKVKRLGTGINNEALLAGILKCSKCGANMIVKQGHKSKTEENKRYDYYVCSAKDNSRGRKCDNKNIRVDRLDKIISEQLIAYDINILRNKLKDLLNKATSIDKNDIINKINSVKSEIETKENAISNLIKQLSAATNESVANYIMQEVDKLSKEVNKLKSSLDTKVTEENVFKSDITNLNIIIDSLNKFSSTYNSLTDIRQKRLLIQTILSKAFWDGENYTAELIILEDKKK